MISMLGGYDGLTRLLIVDDDAGVCETLGDIFSTMDFQVDSAATGGEALTKARLNGGYDAALLDIRLPDIDGLELMKRLRGMMPETVYVLITGHATVSNTVEALKEGASGYFIKPIVIDEMLHVVSGALEKQRLRRQIMESAERYRSLFESSPDGILIIDEDGKITDWNAAAEDIFGLRDREMEARPAAHLMTAAGLEKFAQMLAGSETRRGIVQVEGRHSDGSSIPLEMTVSSWGAAGRRYRTAIVRNVFERLRLEQQLRHAQKMETIGTLAGGIAHDFNNMLAAIIGYTELVYGELAGHKQMREDLQQVLQACERAKNLVRQILSFSRRSEERKVEVELSGIVKETVKLLKASLPANISVRQVMDREGDQVYADPTELHQVVLNLCTNAFQAMREQGGELEIRVGLRLVDDSATGSLLALEPGEYVSLTVCDTGTGIAPEIIDQIFDPYFTTKRKEEGTGLGLAVTYGIVAAAGGGISVSSTPGAGSCFEVLLPRSSGERRVAVPEQRMERARAGESVLLVDDQAYVLQSARRLLESLGYRVEARDSGGAALECLEGEKNDFSVAILDLDMPGMGGLELADRIRERRPGMPILFLSGVIDESKLAAGRDRGHGLVAKPVSLGDLARAVRQAIEQEAWGKAPAGGSASLP